MRTITWIKRVLVSLPMMLGGAVPMRVDAGISVQSDPSNVHLQLRGPLKIEGITPLDLDGLPPGDYLLRATGLGLVTARGRIRSGFDQRVTVQRWATPLAVLQPPGFVHMARGDGWRGSVFTVAAAGGTMGAIVKNAHYDNASSDQDLAQDAYDRASTPSEINAAALNLEAAADRAEDESTMRNIWIGYTAVTWVGAALEAWLLTTPPEVQATGSGSFQVKVPRGRPLDAGLRSALVPGAGQRYMGHGFRGIVFGATVFALSAISLSAYDEYLQAERQFSDAQRRYQAAGSPAESETWRTELEKADNKVKDWQVTAWSLAGTAVAAYAWNVLDAMGLGSTGWGPRGVEVGMSPSPGGLMATFNWRLP